MERADAPAVAPAHSIWELVLYIEARVQAAQHNLSHGGQIAAEKKMSRRVDGARGLIVLLPARE